eukprot:765759-Hanusia_phi.AAC.9
MSKQWGTGEHLLADSMIGWGEVGGKRGSQMPGRATRGVVGWCRRGSRSNAAICKIRSHRLKAVPRPLHSRHAFLINRHGSKRWTHPHFPCHPDGLTMRRCLSEMWPGTPAASVTDGVRPLFDRGTLG